MPDQGHPNADSYQHVDDRVQMNVRSVVTTLRDESADEGTKMIGLGDVGGDGAGAGAGGDCCDNSFVVNGRNAGGRDDSAEFGGDGGDTGINIVGGKQHQTSN